MEMDIYVKLPRLQVCDFLFQKTWGFQLQIAIVLLMQVSIGSFVKLHCDA